MSGACRYAAALLVGLLLLLPSAVWAQQAAGYPEPISPYVNDFAEVIGQAREAQIEQMLRDLREAEGVEFAVVTIRARADYADTDTFEAFATGWFNAWGIGSALENNGVLLMVAVEDRDVRLEVGAGYEDTLNDDMRSVIIEFLLPYFREGDYESGIYGGVRSAIFQLTGVYPPESDPVRPPRAPSSTAESDGADDLPFIIFVILFGLVILYYAIHSANQNGSEGGDFDVSGAGSSWRSSTRSRSSWSGAGRSRSSSTSRRSSFSGGRSKGGGSSGKW